jgi:hypothetical protein
MHTVALDKKGPFERESRYGSLDKASPLLAYPIFDGPPGSA